MGNAIEIQGVNLENSLVVFENFDRFRSIAESDSLKNLLIEKRSEFGTSFSRPNSRTTEENEFPEGFLEYILDPTNSVVIGDYLFQVHFSEELVYAAPVNTGAADQLQEGKVDAKGIMKFSTNDDVLDLIESGYTSSPGGENAAIFCGGGCSSYDLSTSTAPFNPSGNWYYTRVRYVKAGIYFELSYHMYMHWLIAPIALNSQNIPYSTHNIKYERNCKSTIIQAGNNGVSQLMSLQSSDLNGVSATYNFKRGIYSSTQGLKKILMNVNFQVIAPGINVNSQTLNCRF